MKILVAISPHGFGHASQIAPVINALRRRCPDLAITLRTSLPHEVLASRIDGPFELQPRADDFGMVQRSALEVDLEASMRAYRQFHSTWDDRVDGVAEELRANAPDLVLADVPYLTLAAASRAGVPAIGLCCLNWADIFKHYFGHLPEAGVIHGQMVDAYRQARPFLRPEPAMPMPELPAAHSVGPIGRRGRERRAELAARLDLGGERLVVIATGGIAMRLPLERWPRISGVRYLVQPEWEVRHPDAIPFDRTGMPFADLVASADLLITKPGYGAFTEAAACGIPLLYLPRDDWPEAPYLVEWLEHHIHCERLPLQDAEQGAVEPAIERMLTAGYSPPLPMTGADEAAEIVLARLHGVNGK